MRSHFHLFLSAVSVFLIAITANAELAGSQTTRAEVDAKVKSTLQTLYSRFPETRELVKSAAGVLVFPEIAKGGFFVGGEYGHGALMKKGQVVDYYQVAGGSIGLQFGVQVRSQVIIFKTPAAYEGFRQSEGWEVGVDGSVAVATEGAGGRLDSKTLHQPVLAFILGNKGLMVGASLEGTKFTRIDAPD